MAVRRPSTCAAANPDVDVVVAAAGAPVAEAALDRARRLQWYPADLAFDPAAARAMVDALMLWGHVPGDLGEEAWLRDDLRLAAVRDRGERLRGQAGLR